ncbi:MAG: RsmB/NOP family class I SAM-dependent RNA methyltransferase [Chitinophagales bacterium]
MKTNSIKLFPPLIKIVTDVIHTINTDQLPIDKTLAPILKNKQLGSRDRRFIIEQTYDIIRNRSFFDSVLNHWKLPTDVPHQILVNLLNNDVQILNPEIISPNFKYTSEDLNNIELTDSNQNSFPDWMEKEGRKDYGEEWDKIAQSLNESAKIYIRPNTLLTSAQTLQNKLSRDRIDTVKKDESLLLVKKDNLKNHKLYLKGHFEIQDWASQQVAVLADIQEDQLVVDACAGAGGKTLHLAALLNQTGRIIASDFNDHRLKQLTYRMERAKANEIEIIDYDQLHIFEGNVDRLILDVPCTATGTIRRKPEIKWNVSEENLKAYITTQQQILTKQSPLVKTGGLLIYATCSIFKAESEDQVQWFLANNKNFELVQEKRFLPHIDRCDGFYIGVLRKVS